MSTEPKAYGGSVTTQAHLRELWTILGASTQQEARRAVQQLLKISTTITNGNVTPLNEETDQWIRTH